MYDPLLPGLNRNVGHFKIVFVPLDDRCSVIRLYSTGLEELDTNLRFIIVRRFANLEWETYQDKKDNSFIALCHKHSLSVQSDNWNGIWDEIMKASKELFKKRKVRKVGSYG